VGGPGWAELDILIGTHLLGRSTTEVLEHRVESLEVSRSWAVEIAEAERRRIERDLHDGAQQRLVAVAMDLGMARDRVDDDPERTRELIEHAHDEAKRAIVELRDLARGIHPVALGDRGLAGAVAALAGRSPIPVEAVVDVPHAPPPAIEGIAYFVISECLANAVKHSSASRVWVRVAEHDGRLYVKVIDDGVGGADLALGTGLIGLSERVASVDGTFEVSSPLAGPTQIQVELPCAS
jgi:signal transduction histidine kinase